VSVQELVQVLVAVLVQALALVSAQELVAV
jgi:hypothetical protein